MGLPGQVLLLGEVAVGLPGPDLISRNDLACAAAGATRKGVREKTVNGSGFGGGQSTSVEEPRRSCCMAARGSDKERRSRFGCCRDAPDVRDARGQRGRS